ncbi:MAG: hypothetical protein J6D37_04155 [Clostridia bacterium]|nr:hypothetical protein [Clostridia bacterium]
MKKFFRFLTNPPVWFLFLLYPLGLAVIAGSIYFAVSGDEAFYVYPVYLLAAAGLFFIVCSLTGAIARLKRGMLSVYENSKLKEKYLSDYDSKTLVFGGVSFLINVVYALYNGALGIYYRSIWYAALCGYFLALGFLRFLLVERGRRARKREEKRRLQWKSYSLCGAGLIVVDLAFSGAIAQMVIFSKGASYAGFLIYAAAAYTFYKIIIAIVNFFGVRKKGDPVSRALRNINLTAATASLYSLQIALVDTFSEGGVDYSMRLLNGGMGAAVALLVLSIGVFMVVYGNRQCKKEEKADV